MFDVRRKTPDELRSARWFAPDDLRSFGHRSRLMQLGYAEEEFMGKPMPPGAAGEAGAASA